MLTENRTLIIDLLALFIFFLILIEGIIVWEWFYKKYKKLQYKRYVNKFFKQIEEHRSVFE